MEKTVAIPSTSLRGIIPEDSTLTGSQIQGGQLVVSFTTKEVTDGFDPAVFDWLKQVTKDVTSGRGESETLREYIHDGHRC